MSPLTIRQIVGPLIIAAISATATVTPAAPPGTGAPSQPSRSALEKAIRTRQAQAGQRIPSPAESHAARTVFPEQQRQKALDSIFRPQESGAASLQFFPAEPIPAKANPAARNSDRRPLAGGSLPSSRSVLPGRSVPSTGSTLSNAGESSASRRSGTADVERRAARVGAEFQARHSAAASRGPERSERSLAERSRVHERSRSVFSSASSSSSAGLSRSVTSADRAGYRQSVRLPVTGASLERYTELKTVEADALLTKRMELINRMREDAKETGDSEALREADRLEALARGQYAARTESERSAEAALRILKRSSDNNNAPSLPLSSETVPEKEVTGSDMSEGNSATSRL